MTTDDSASLAQQIREKAQGSTDRPFWFYVAAAVEQLARERDAEFEVAERLRVENYEARALLTGCATVLRIIASGRRGEEYPYAQTRGGSMIEVAALLARIDAAIQPGLSKGEDECS